MSGSFDTSEIPLLLLSCYLFREFETRITVALLVQKLSLRTIDWNVKKHGEVEGLV